MSKRYVVLVSLAVAVARASEAQYDSILRRAEFRVNTYTTGDQSQADIAAAADGRFVVVWTSASEDGSDHGVVGQRFDTFGRPEGPPFAVNAFTTGPQGRASVAMDGSGNFVVVWHGVGPDENLTYGVFAQRFDAASNRLGTEFHVNQWTTSDQGLPSVAADPGGNFIVAWQSLGQEDPAAGMGVYARRYDAGGNPLGNEFLVNETTVGFQGRPAVAVDPSGGALVVWEGAPATPDPGNSADILGRLYDAGGLAVAGEFLVNNTTGDTQAYPAVAAGGGQFVVAWRSPDAPGSGLGGVAVRRVSSTGVPQGGDFIANEYTTGTQRGPSLTVAPDGSFLVAWGSPDQDGSGEGVFARRFTAAGTAKTRTFQVNRYTTGSQSYPTVVTRGRGDFVVAWSSVPQDGSGSGVFGLEAFDSDIFADGFESGGLGAWSSSASDGGDLLVDASAGMRASAFGLRAEVDDTAPLYVEDTTPRRDPVYRARFYVDPNGFDPGEAESYFRTRIFVGFEEAPSRRLFAVVLKRQSGQYSLALRTRRDDNTHAESGFFPIGDGPHHVEVHWQRSSVPGADDGWAILFIDGAEKSWRTNLPLDNRGVDFVRLGALSVKAGASGALYFDEFVSTRGFHIGP